MTKSIRRRELACLAAAALLPVMALPVHAQLPAGNWQYFWGDEFGGAAIDTTKWDVASPSWGMSTAAPTAASANKVRVGDGVLTLEATRTKVNGSNAAGDENFVGGLITTYTKQRFVGGYIEASILLPETVGSWPAFWGLFDGWPPEADIMEYPLRTVEPSGSGYHDSDYHTAFHYSTGSGNAAGAGKITNPLGTTPTPVAGDDEGNDLGGVYHRFGMEWRPNDWVGFYFNGQLVSQFGDDAAVAQMQNMYLILNYAVGGWPGTPSTSQWPVGFSDETKVDYVRVWKAAPASASNWTYSGTATSVNWDTAGNWSNGAPNLGGTTASFGTVNAASQNIDWSGRRTVSVVNLSGATRYRLGSGDERLVMGMGNNGTQTPTLQVASTATTDQEVQATIEFAGGLNLNNNSTQPLLLTGSVIGGGGDVRVSGPGRVDFRGANSYTANTLVGVGQGPGVARASGASPFGVGGTVIIGEAGNSTEARLELEGDAVMSNNLSLRGRQNVNSPAIVNLSGDSVIRGSVELGFGGSSYRLHSESGSLALSGDAGQAGGVAVTTLPNMGARTLVLDGDGNGAISGVIQNANGTTLGLVKIGSGVWTLGGDNNYAGATVVNQGTLVVDGKTGAGGTIVAPGASLAGRGTVRGNLVTSAGANVLVGGQGPQFRTEVLVDDFSGDLSAYTNTRILDNNGGAANTSSWNIADGRLQIATTAYDGIEQAALTRLDHPLKVGDEIRVDYTATALDSQDIGLYVGAGAPTPGVRADYLNIYVRNDGAVYSRGFNGSAELPLVSAGAVSLDSLFVARTGGNTFELGYYSGGVRTVVTNRVMSSSAIGSAIGFYSDIRSGGARGGLDNLVWLDPDSTELLSNTLTVEGDFMLDAGADLVFDIYRSDAYDHLAVGGQFSALGSLQVEIDQLLAPLQPGDAFDLVDATSIVGGFASVELPVLPLGFVWDTEELLEQGVLRVAAGLAGDFNGDGQVDAADFTEWRDAEGQTGAGLDADANGDLAVDDEDYAIWSQNYGLSLSAIAAQTATTPEPSALGLAILAVLCRRLVGRRGALPLPIERSR